MTAAATSVEIKFEYSQSQEGLVVPLFHIDTETYPNPGGGTRGSVEGMMELRKSLRVEKQLQPIRCAVSEDGLKASVYAGFRRTEAKRQNALEKVVKAYNAAKELKAGDDGYIVLNDPTSREKVHADTSEIPDSDGDTWANAFERALKEETILVAIGEVDNMLDARLKNLAENENREDFTTMELCSTITALIAEGAKQKDIGKSLGRSESKISQSVKIAKLPKAIRDLIEEHAADDQKELLNSCVDELERRMGLSKGDKCNTSFSHLREFSGRVLVSGKKEPLTFDTTINILKVLVRCSDNGKINGEQETMDYGVFVAKIKDEEKKAKLATKEEEKAEEAADGVTAADVADAQAGSADGGAAAAEANAQEEDAAPAAETSEAASDSEVAEPVTESEEDAGAVETVTEESDSVDELDTAAEASETADELAGGDDEAQAEIGTEVNDGQSRTKTTDAPTEDAFKVKDAVAIRDNADQYRGFALEGDTPTAERAVFLGIAAELYDVIGMKAEYKTTSAAGNQYLEDLNAYIDLLQKSLKDAGIDKEKLKGIAAKRPVVTGLDSESTGDED